METLVVIAAAAMGLLSLMTAVAIRRRVIQHRRRRRAALEEGEQILARLGLLAATRARTSGERPTGTTDQAHLIASSQRNTD